MAPRPGPRHVALITGAARGMGAALARRLAADGWALVLFDGPGDDPALTYALGSPAELAATVEACGEATVGVEGDVRNQADLDAAVASATTRFGGLDAVVAAAGVIGGGAPAWEAPDALWDVMMRTNLEGVWRTARAAVPALLARPRPRRGRVVAVASAGGSVGLPLLSAYCASKAGVIGFVRSLAVELAPEGVTANVIAPGSTATAMLDASATVYGLDTNDEFATHQPVGRLLDPDEPAALAAWLCGPDASGVTGAVLPVDGGMTAT